MFNWFAFLTYAVITAATPGPNNIMSMFALLLAFIGFVFTLCWSAFGSAFRLLFSRHTKSVNTIMALLLVYCAASLFGY